MNKHRHPLRFAASLLLSAALLFGTAVCLPASRPVSAAEAAASAKETGTSKGRKTPVMGWASWNGFHCDIDEDLIYAQMDQLVKLGLRDLGYTFLNVDDGWQNGRGTDGNVKVNTAKFPNGMKAVADRAHSKGLSAGIYTDAGILTCGYRGDKQVNNFNVGLYGHDQHDLDIYLNRWGFDFIKVDWCGGEEGKMDTQTRYTEIGKTIAGIEKATGKDKIYNICCWGFPGSWAPDWADSWRTGGDIAANFESILKQTDSVKRLSKYVGPGHVNDLDMLQVGNGMTYDEDKTHFSLWCMMSSPLMLGMDLRNITDETLSIVTNKELIAIDQDPACIQAETAVVNSQYEIWQKPLGSADSATRAVALINRSDVKQSVTLDFRSVGLTDVSLVRDLWLHQDIPVTGSYTVTLPAHGCVILKVTGKNVQTKDRLLSGEPVFEAMPALSEADSTDYIDYTKKRARQDGKQLVRPEEYTGKEQRFTANLSGGNASCTVWVGGEGSTTLTATFSGQTIKKEVTLSADKPVRLELAYQSAAGAELTFTVSGNAVLQGVLVQSKADAQVYRTAPESTLIGQKLSVVQSVSFGKTAGLEADSLALVFAFYDSDDLFVSADIQPCQPLNAVQDIIGTLEIGEHKTGTLRCYLWQSGTPLCPEWVEEISFTPKKNAAMIGPVTTRSLLDQGAILLDVRTPEEYAAGHLEKSVNLDYTKILTEAEQHFPDKNAIIITYCSAAKRSVQAMTTLKDLGYQHVYCLGSMANYQVQTILNFQDVKNKLVRPGDKVSTLFVQPENDSLTLKYAVGENATVKDAVPAKMFVIPADNGQRTVTVKAYATYEDKVYAEASQTYLYNTGNLVDVYASTLKFTRSTCGYGSVTRDTSNGGNMITIAGTTYEKGLGVHADSIISMAIPAGAKEFIAVAGLDDEVLSSSKSNKVKFSVQIDGKQIGNEHILQPGQEFIFDLQIPAGAKEITLIADKAYDDNYSDHADWGVAGFRTKD